jgi:phage baseplate assembly protein V
MPTDNGILIGQVTSLDDPESLGRIKVKYPTLGQQESDWASMVTLMAGKERGAYFIPEVGEVVLVAFANGDPRHPYILGGVWNSKDKPPATDGDKKQNNWRFIKSRSGHIIKLDDTSGSEKIEIIDKDSSHKIVIDSANRKIQVVCDNGDIEVSAGSGKVTVKATTIELKASGSMTLSANGDVTISGATVKIN